MCDGEPRYRVEQIWDGLYRDLRHPDEITNLPKKLRATLNERAPLALDEVQVQHADKGQTLKWLWRAHDGHQVETVLMLYPDRATVCVSSQAGCAMACGFCATGQAGFDRHLTTGEIVEQVVTAARAAGDRRVSNVVFMGMGEPLANFGQVWPSVERFHQDLGMSARSITVSTVGLIPGIRKLTEADLPVTLAVSLHAANDRLRDDLVPINRRYPIDALCDAMIAYRERKGRRVSLEWALIHQVNDSDRDAEELAAVARRVRAHVNLIPLNPTPGYPVRGAPPKRLYAFRDRLEELGANATVRRTRGLEIDAACGQLAARHRTDAPADQAVSLTPRARPNGSGRSASD
ncbi:MAG: 23S rRNA (adenine(2503)-C(2))-methyltransferase RlmN [Actinomycetota bacterium]